ncbi:MAG: fumarate hydratase C-terminal domain-containing protein [Oscillospiraceae bacterium]|nr:fumarate hydratase C-terminal domain-containing protein [Oscillospiraceae bacterium]
MATIDVHTSELCKVISQLHAGDRVLLTGTVYTSRDAAHKELFRLLDENKELPFDVKDAVIYYAGPTPGRDDCATGSCGPTTSSRMDGFAPRLYDLGLAATIGKGERNQAVIDSIVRNGAVYLCAVGGAGALISKHITAAEEIAFLHLGCESVKKLTVEKLPLTVGVDAFGGNIFKEAREKYKR